MLNLMVCSFEVSSEAKTFSLVANKNNAHVSTPPKVDEKVKVEAEIDVDKVDNGEWRWIVLS